MQKQEFPGKFIVLEGIDGSGISTQSGILKRYLENKYGRKVLLSKEPSEGPIGTLIRQVLTHRIQGIQDESLALLFAADRIDHLQHRIVPALQQGSTVICDRYVWSSIAYQGMKMDEQWILETNKYAIKPDLTIFVKVRPEVSIERITQNRFQTDVFEKETILNAVMSNYIQIMNTWRKQGENILELSGEDSVENIAKTIAHTVDLLM